jgi:26S proteasome regulatory subunit N10
MPLESCMILLDNSEYMRNGDYIPTRLEAQQDAANLLVGAKTQSHPESTVGVSAGTELLVSPTDDVGKILNALHGLPMNTHMVDITASVQVASLALKHRRNKNGSQRIVLFVGSPLTVEGRALAKAGRQLKKNNVSIDVVCMGELEDNEDKLKELVDAANGRSEEGAERTCHLLTIPAGVLPSDVLASSPIVHGGSGGSAFAASAASASASGGGGTGGGGGEGGGGGGAAGEGFGDFGGVDPNMDPELAMALRISMEEERARQERVTAAAAAAATAAEEGGGESKDAEMTDAPAAAPPAEAAVGAAMDMGLSEEEALLQQALAMSMNENEPEPTSPEAAKEDAKPAAAAAAGMDTEEDEVAAMQMALQMSMQQESTEGEQAGEGEGEQQQFQDPQFVNQLLGSLPGVNPDDPAIQNALRNLKDKKDGDDDAKKDSDKKE